MDCLARNEKAGVIYHREGVSGDYDAFDHRVGPAVAKAVAKAVAEAARRTGVARI